MQQSAPPRVFDSLTDVHRVFGLAPPLHPLVSCVDLSQVRLREGELGDTFVLNFYKVAYKLTARGQARYGQQYYDFGQGGLVCTAPNQTFESPVGVEAHGVMLLFHSDLLLSYPLAHRIRDYGFFDYAASEALHVSEQEKEILLMVFRSIELELDGRIDDSTQDVVVSQIELLLNYSRRYYRRQFITRKAANNSLLQRMEEILSGYFDHEEAATRGLPTVQYLAEQLHLSPSYLSDMLRSLTGRSAQQHIHDALITKAKERLTTTDRSVSEIAYDLGFGYAQSFSRLFKTKTRQSPLEFRRSFR